MKERTKSGITALYARVSTDKQDATAQLMLLRQVAERRRWGNTIELVDEGASGAQLRPALERTWRLARAGRLARVAVVEVSRLGRTLDELIRRVLQLRSWGVALVSVRDGLDLGRATADDEAAELQWQLLAVLSQFERNRIRKRTREALERARERGQRLGRPRRGDVSVIRIEQMLAEGMSQRSIAKQLGCDERTVRRRLTEARQNRGSNRPPAKVLSEENTGAAGGAA